MNDEPILLSVSGHVAVLTLNRPDSRNALSGEAMFAAFALALAHRIAANPPQVLRWTRQLRQHGRTGTLDDALEAAARLQGLAHHTPEHAEAITAYFEKLAPSLGHHASTNGKSS